MVYNVFYVKYKNLFQYKKKYIIEITNFFVNFYDEKFENKLNYFKLKDLKNIKILDNILELKYIKNKFETTKKIYFVNQNYSLHFYKYLTELYYFNYNTFDNNNI
tara:strand:- start:140 stop:454 length:315 start_codon:yes stop_codon:yes gene_type:complete